MQAAPAAQEGASFQGEGCYYLTEGQPLLLFCLAAYSYFNSCS